MRSVFVIRCRLASRCLLRGRDSMCDDRVALRLTWVITLVMSLRLSARVYACRCSVMLLLTRLLCRVRLLGAQLTKLARVVVCSTAVWGCRTVVSRLVYRWVVLAVKISADAAIIVGIRVVVKVLCISVVRERPLIRIVTLLGVIGCKYLLVLSSSLGLSSRVITLVVMLLVMIMCRLPIGGGPLLAAGMACSCICVRLLMLRSWDPLRVVVIGRMATCGLLSRTLFMIVLTLSIMVRLSC